MKKRPLALLCLAVAIFFSIMGRIRGSERDEALLEVEEYLTETAGSGNTLTLEGTVSEVSAVSEGIRLSVNQVVLYTNDKSIGSLSSELKILFTTETDNLLPGDRVRVTGTWKPFETAGNPGQFDFRTYYFAKNTAGRVTSAGITLVSEGDSSLARMLARFRRILRCSYLRILEEKAARTVSAISLGEKSYMEQEWKQLYQEGGIAHIISISGLHISMIGMCIYKLLRRIRLPFALAALPSAAVVALYALMAGFGVSAVRACIMFVLWLGSQIAGRKNDTLTAAAVAAALILAGNGRTAESSSFLLSFMAILSIALLVPRLQAVNPFRIKRVNAGREKKNLQNGSGKITRANGGRKPLGNGKQREKWKESVLRTGERIWDTFCGGAGVWLGTLPVTLWFFYQTAPWSVLVNLAVIPLMSALMGSALISCLVGLVSVPAGIFLSAPVYYLLGFFETLCTFEQQLPGAVWIAGCPALWKAAAYYVLLFAAAGLMRFLERHGENTLCTHKKDRIVRQFGFDQRQRAARKRYFQKQPRGSAQRKQRPELRYLQTLVWICAIGIGLCLMAFHPRSGLTVICMDVGQGDGALIQLPDGTNCLIDGGSSSVSSLWEYRISQVVKYYGISRLDYVFLSHADSDHISGIEEYLEDYLPGFAGNNAHGITLENLILPPTADAEDFGDLTASAEKLDISVFRMEAGAGLGSTSSWSFACLAPDAEALSGDKNEDSMVLLLQYGDFRMLFTGDLEGEAELALAASGANLSCDVLKVGHHGSKGASSEAFLLAASPAFGIISCGKDNSYGHPAAAAVERLRAADITLYTTMDCGAVTIRSNGSTYRISGYIKTENYST
ncbi:MAG: ComEC/Rec2 family competence protein [Lachnospiraceae bacterium]|nr:ComEC/Rec2 family competence protein [Lachnospiraceae bacterium]